MTNLALALSIVLAAAAGSETASWPPPLKGAKQGTVNVTSRAFVTTPPEVKELAQEEGAAPFAVAKQPPLVSLALHDQLGSDPAKRRLWSSWGDICVASDGRVYCAIGDHGDAVGGDARCFLYRWDPQVKVLEQIVDMNQVVPQDKGLPAWSKVHAKIDEGSDGKIYFSCTLNDGNRAGQEAYQWNDELPGGQIYRYDPETGQTTVFANLPPKRCTATSILDSERNVWWCNLEAGDGDALWGLDMVTKQVVFKSDDGQVAFNRNFALASDGSIYFNGASGIEKYNARTGKIEKTESSFGESPGMRCSTRESKGGIIYGCTHKTSQLFAYDTGQDKLTLLGPSWLTGQYTTVMQLSPDEKYLYYLPGAHGKAWTYGTPVVQYDIAKGQRKVLAFLAPTLEKKTGFVPGGTYGMKLSGDGSKLYVNFNGHATDSLRPEHMKPIGFGLCGFVQVDIPAEER